VADFTFLLRPDRGYAAAGFPSKVPESLAAGCPVIVNLTSDLGFFLKDGTDSLICDGADIDDVLRALSRALKLNRAELQQMSIEAAATAARYFDYEVWAGPLDTYLRDRSTTKRRLS
jgi:glycosyltransferase involved in cell wall biosynthesis